MGTSVLGIFYEEDFPSRLKAGLRTQKSVSLRGSGPDARSAGEMTLPRSSQIITKQLQRHASKRRPSTSPDRNAHRFRTPQSAEQQPFNLPNPESAGKIIYRSSLLKKQPLLGASLPAGWSVSEKFSYQQNFPTPPSGARGRGGEEDFMGRAQPCADFFFGKKMGGKRW